MTSVVDPDGKTWACTYDGAGDLIGATDPLTHVTKFAYNDIGWLTTLTEPLLNSTTFTRNFFGDVTVITDPHNQGPSTPWKNIPIGDLPVHK